MKPIGIKRRQQATADGTSSVLAAGRSGLPLNRKFHVRDVL
jgi:hypothetical protein